LLEEMDQVLDEALTNMAREVKAFFEEAIERQPKEG